VAIREAFLNIWDAWKGTVTVGSDTVYIENSFIDNIRADFGQSGENNILQTDVRFLYRS